MNIATPLIMFFVVVGFALSIEKSFTSIVMMLGVYIAFCLLSKVTARLVNWAPTPQ